MLGVGWSLVGRNCRGTTKIVTVQFVVDCPSISSTMSEQGAALQTYNQELVKGIEALKRRRSDLLQSIREDEQLKEVLEKEMESVKEKLTSVCSRLNDRLQKKAFYDNAIENSETAYMKILESSQALLTVVRQDAMSLEYTSKQISP